MTDTSDRRRLLGHPLIVPSAQLLALTSFAITQPMLGLIGRQLTFFASENTTPLDLALYLAALTVAPWAVLSLIEIIALRSAGRRGLDLVHATFVLLLSLLLFLPVVKHAEWPEWATLGASLALATVFAFGVLKMRLLSRLAVIAAGSSMAFVAIFLLATPVLDTIRNAEAVPIGSELEFRRTPPIVILRMDEFPLPSLIRPDGAIDEARFPNFARLARRSTWYRDTTTTATGTRWAVPSIYSGLRPKSLSAQIPAHHPRTLFTALGGRYRFEGGTEGICPTSVCTAGAPSRRKDGGASTLGRLFRNSGWIYGHIVGTRAVAQALPPPDAIGLVDHFAPPTIAVGRPSIPDARWTWAGGRVEHIGRDGQPQVSVISVALPHRPWTLLPSGQTHSEPSYVVPGLTLREPWANEPHMVRAALQAHLVQVGATDTLLGRVIDRLEAKRIYDEVLLIAVADHGASFIPGGAHRGLGSEDALPDIATVPLFIKYPGQSRGKVDDRLAEVHDVFPTVLDVLGVDPGWEMDGVSLLDRPSARRSRMILDEFGQVQRIPSDMYERTGKAAMRKFRFSGLPQDPDDEVEAFFAFGPHLRYVGKDPSDFEGGPTSQLALQIEDEHTYRDVDLRGDVLPAAVTAFVTSRRSAATVVVALNDRIVGVAPIVDWEGESRLDVLFWPGFLDEGSNELSFYELLRGSLRRIRIDAEH